ncbi:MAG: hypothetical protein QXT16_08995 [Candidatus Caldarchaeum sp.]
MEVGAVWLRLGKTLVQLGEYVDFEGSISPPLPLLEVKIKADEQVLATVTTDAFGRFSGSLMFTASGKFKVRAVVLGKESDPIEVEVLSRVVPVEAVVVPVVRLEVAPPPPEILDQKLTEVTLRNLVDELHTRLVTILGLPSHPVSIVDTKTTSSTEYVDVVSWTVGGVWGEHYTIRGGEVKEISLTADPLENAVWRLRVFKAKIATWVTVFADKILPTTLTIPFAPNRLESGDIVAIQVKSSTGASIKASASITGREF